MANLFQQLLGDDSADRMLQEAASLRAARMKQQAAVVEQQRKTMAGNLELLADEAKLDKMVANAYAPLAPAMKKDDDASEFLLKTDAIDAAIPEDHPQAGRARLFKEEFRRRLASDDGAGRSAAEILLEMQGQEFEAVREDAYRYKREADSSLLDIIPFVDTEDDNIRKLPGYEEWLEREKAYDNARFAAEDKLFDAEDWLKGLAVSAGLGAGIALTGGLLAPVLPGALGTLAGGMSMGGGLLGALRGAGSFMAFDAGQKPARALLHQTEWYQANKGAGSSVDSLQAGAADLGLTLGAGFAAERLLKKGLQKLLTEPVKEIAETALANPQAGKELVPYVQTLKRADRMGRAGVTSLPAPEMKSVVPSVRKFGVGTAKATVRKPVPTAGLIEDGIGKPNVYAEYENFSRAVQQTPPSFAFGVKDSEKALLVVKGYPGTLPSKVAEKIFNAMKPQQQQKAIQLATNKNFMKQVGPVDPLPAAVRDVKQAEIVMEQVAKADGSYVWTKKVTQRVAAGKPVPKVDVYRAVLEASDPLELTRLQAAGKLTIRQAEAIKAGGSRLKSLKTQESSRILKRMGFIPERFLAVGGLSFGTVALADMLSPEDVEAGIFSTLTTRIPKMFAGGMERAVAEGHATKYLEEMKKIGQVIIESSNAREMPIQMQQQFNVAEYAKKAYGSLLNSIEDVSKQLRGKLGPIARYGMSPGFYGDLIAKEKGRVSAQMASAEAAIAANSAASMKVYNSIIERIPGVKGNTNAIAKEMQDIALRMPEEAGPYAALKTKVDNIKNVIAGLEKDVLKKGNKAAKDVIRGNIERKQAELQALKPEIRAAQKKYGKFVSDVTRKQKELAKKYASARLALAAEDTADFTARPWLKDLMSVDEIEATAYLRKLFQHYGKRMESVGHNPIKSKPYVHHPLHPSLAGNKQAMEKLAELQIVPGKSIPFTKFFQRAKMSQQLVPDIDFIMQRYIPDAEKRINWTQFWNDWKGHADSVQGLPGHKEFWDTVKSAMKPPEAIPLYQWANRYYQFEVVNLIGGSLSAALKHLFKLEGTVANFGFKETFKHAPEAVGQANRLAREYIAETGLGKLLGVKPKQVKTATDELVDAYLAISRNQHTFAEMHLDAGIVNKSLKYEKLDKVLRKSAEVGTFPIKWVEWWDRAHSVLAIRAMAEKQAIQAAKGVTKGGGLTAFDASYQTWDTMIKMNFMGGSLNPAWQRNPALRTLFMFQNTPAKLLERRLVNSLKTKDAVVKAKNMVFKRYEDRVKALEDVQGMMRYVKAAELEIKQGILADTVKVMDSVKTPSGQPYYKQFFYDALISGGLIAGGGALYDADLKSHVFHFPFLKAHSEEPTLSVAPIVSGAYRTLEHKGEDNDDMFMTRFMHNWLGKKGLFPQAVWKQMRIHEGDIPDIYKDSWMKYFFAIPAKKD